MTHQPTDEEPLHRQNWSNRLLCIVVISGSLKHRIWESNSCSLYLLFTSSLVNISARAKIVVRESKRPLNNNFRSGPRCFKTQYKGKDFFIQECKKMKFNKWAYLNRCSLYGDIEILSHDKRWYRSKGYIVSLRYSCLNQATGAVDFNWGITIGWSSHHTFNDSISRQKEVMSWP